MATYAIGDIQGCFQSLLLLLKTISFDNNRDTLWFTGDLVNRGPQSLEVLRFIHDLGPKHKLVLGNHDLHLMAVFYHPHLLKKEDTLASILKAHDGNQLIVWLSQQPLFYYDDQFQFALVHAGMAPDWTISKAKALSQEVEVFLKSDQAGFFLKEMYGDKPNQWKDQLSGIPRLRCITNYFTRARLCNTEGCLDFSFKGQLAHKPASLVPWYALPKRASATVDIIFGHWAALRGEVDLPHLYPLDTGCVWGHCLSAMRLEDRQLFHVDCASLFAK